MKINSNIQPVFFADELFQSFCNWRQCAQQGIFTLCINLEHMDKKFFIDSQYYLNNGDYHSKLGVKPSSARKGKNVLEVGSSWGTAFTLSLDADDEVESLIDPMTFNLDLTAAPLDAPLGNIETNNMKGCLAHQRKKSPLPQIEFNIKRRLFLHQIFQWSQWIG